MSTYRRKNTYIMLKGTPENLETIAKWGYYFDETFSDPSELCIVFDQNAGLVSDVLSEEGFSDAYEEILDSSGSSDTNV